MKKHTAQQVSQKISAAPKKREIRSVINQTTRAAGAPDSLQQRPADDNALPFNTRRLFQIRPSVDTGERRPHLRENDGYPSGCLCGFLSPG